MRSTTKGIVLMGVPLGSSLPKPVQAVVAKIQAEERLAPVPEVVVLPAPLPEKKPSEMDEILREMKRFNSAVVDILRQPSPPAQVSTITAPAPIVRVEAPSVSVTPSIRIEQPARRWKFTVTQRDFQQRIKEIIVESLE